MSSKKYNKLLAPTIKNNGYLQSFKTKNSLHPFKDRKKKVQFLPIVDFVSNERKDSRSFVSEST